MADGVGDSSVGDGVAVETGAAALVETAGDGSTAVGGEGVHAVAIMAISAAMSPHHKRGTSKTSDDLTWRASERNALD
jgi:hypothetical protein